MKKIRELLALVALLATERSAIVTTMELAIDKAETEDRAFTDAETTLYDANKLLVSGIDEKITTKRERIEILERQEELNKLKVVKKDPETPEVKVSKRFNLFKAFRESLSGQLSGVELEVTQEGHKSMREAGVAANPRAIVIPPSMLIVGTKKQLEERAAVYVATGDGDPPIKLDYLNTLSIVRTPILIDTLGVTQYPGLIGSFGIPSMAQLAATFVNEESAVDSAAVVLAEAVLTPRRVGSSEIFTNELLQQTNPQIQSDIMRAFVEAIWVTVQKDLMDTVAAGGTIHGTYEITDTVAATTYACALALEASIENQGDNMAYVASRANVALMKALVLDSGSGKFLFQDNMINGYNAYGTAALAATNGGGTNTAFDFIFGDWRKAVVGSWGGIELIVDPYTKATNGAIQITASGLFDTEVANILGFAVARNASA